MPFVAVAGLGAVADAILAVVVLLAIIGIAYLIQKFGSYIPYIGGWLAAQAVRFLQLTRDALAYFYKAEVWALQTVINGVVVGVTYPLSKILDVANVTVGAIYWLRNVAIPRWFNAAIDFGNRVALAAYAYALSLYNNAIGYALALYYQAIAFGQSVAAAAYAYALTLYYQSIAYALSLYNVARADIATLEATVGADLAALSTFVGAEIALAELYAQSLVESAVGALEADIAAVESRLTALLESYVAAAEKDVLTLVDGAAVVALTDVWPGLVTDVDGILAEIPKELTDIRDLLARIPRAIPGGLLDALTALGVLAIPLLRYLRECGVPMCRDLHGLGDLFNGLNSLATDAALIAFFAECVHDPHAAANMIISVVGPVAHEATTLTRDLVGA